jgi:uncharacterized membrane protein YidH (DUF202 family)
MDLRRLGWTSVTAAIGFGALSLGAAQIGFFELQLDTPEMLIANRVLNIALLLEIIVFLAGLLLLGLARFYQARGQS